MPRNWRSAPTQLGGSTDLALGNVVGSNIFNILLVVGVAAVIAPRGLIVPVDALRFDLPVMIAVAVACLPIFVTGGVISRSEGVFFLLYYAAYTGFLLIHAGRHRPHEPSDAVGMIFIVPPILVGLVLTLRFTWRRLRKQTTG
ncbi:MAG TPA: hypothetical protein VLM89_04395 [Phycisphaerae bacterium]|nr:hypothetical protein [Phycisphaerae bacterium]